MSRAFAHRDRRKGACARSAALVACVAAMAACRSDTTTLATDGTTGAPQSALGWFLLIVSAVVIVVITVLVLVAALRRRTATVRSPKEVRWIVIGGVVVPFVILLAAFLFTVSTINATASPGRAPTTHVDVIAHQWWWQLTYRDSTTSNDFATANELHIPVGEPVVLQLQSADVIHSFWVPRLAGKMDVIPGQSNQLWIEARRAGTYLGECGEYCGAQHAHMRLAVIAEPPAKFRAWLAAQREPSIAATDSATTVGRAVFLGSACTACHTIRGTPAAASVGPDLTHIGSRTSIAAGAVPNTFPNLIAWVSDPQGIKPGNDMPPTGLPPADAAALAAYLHSLR